MKIPVYLCLCCSIVFFACEKKIDYNPETVPAPVLYIEGYVGPDVGVSLTLRQTLSISGDTMLIQKLLINNAFVLLEPENGSPVKIPFAGKGQYRLPDSLLHIQPGARYRISAKASGFDSIRSDWTRVPLAPDTRQFNFKPDASAGLSINGFTLGKGGFQFDDRPGEDVCYTFVLRGIVGNRLERLECGVRMPGGGNLCPLLEPLLLQDVILNGSCIDGKKSINVGLESELHCYISNTTDVTPTGVVFYFAAADPIFYQYADSNIQPEDIEKGFSEPKLTVTNIHGGFGVFYGINRQVFQSQW